MHGGRIYEYAEQSGRSLTELLDFSANINPLGPPSSVMSAIQDALKEIRHYPDARQSRVIETIRSKYGLSEDYGVFCGNGASEILDLTIRSLSPKRVWILEPAFSEYRQAAYRAGAKVMEKTIGNTSLQNTLLEIVDSSMKGDLLIINNPHNPTGYCWRQEEFSASLPMLCRKEVTVLLDESFMDFRLDEENRTLMRQVIHLPNLVVVRSATKMYAIPGLRFGYGIAHRELSNRIEHNRDRWSVNHLAQAAATAAYQDRAFSEATWNWLSHEQQYILATWGSSNAGHLFMPSVNYFLFRFHENIPVHKILKRLEAEGIFVRRCHDFATLSERYIRVAIQTHSANESLWNALNQALQAF
ncbi:aminotransferase class I/II-fold pyridoxal phosphate-dependent enzyme [Alicyclobacillus sp. TC]|uniref:pyridoxal phosphate-dependent aminotransferase n=1 Tax=Alicyclobacillus sp. TC TaxID=2606450 RepID=UPI00193279DA|nr:aminotransferase class I/II-fold pyridoxal phosphate-dependent enzyme [Alicyclobacillus sp. TC]QRF22982.1 aminotransferase class I/II-fold pyridoxal phosphate-dependent enzyme [Alicyclobacillus sp. TC]